LYDKGENDISLLGLTGYVILEVISNYVMRVEILISVGDVKHMIFSKKGHGLTQWL
jgi:hypothetical protein